MANNDFEQNLVIRATDEASQPIKQVVDQVKVLTDTLKNQIEASKSGATSISEFNKALRDTKSAAKGIVQQSSFLAGFQQIEDRFNGALGKLTELRRQRDEAAAKPQEDRSKDDDRQLRSLDRQIAALEKQFATAEKAYNNANEKLERMGVTAREAVVVNQELLRVLQQIASVRTEGQQANVDFLPNLKAARGQRAAADAAAAEEKADDDARRRYREQKAKEDADFEKQRVAARRVAATTMYAEMFDEIAARDKLEKEAQAAEQRRAEARTKEDAEFEEKLKAGRRTSSTNMYAGMFDEVNAREKARAEAEKLEADEEKARQRRAEERAKEDAEFEEKLKAGRRTSSTNMYAGMFDEVNAREKARAEAEKLEADEQKASQRRAEERAKEDAEFEEKLKAGRRTATSAMYSGLFDQVGQREAEQDAERQRQAEAEQLDQFRARAAEAVARNRAAMDEARRATGPAPEATSTAEAVRSQTRGAPDPTLEAVEAQVDRLRETLAQGSRNVRGFTEALRNDVKAATDEVLRQARIVDEFTARRQAVTDAETRANASSAELEALHARVEAATSVPQAKEVTSQIPAAQRKAASDTAGLAEARVDYEAARRELEKLGVAEEGVFAATIRLTDAAANSARVLKQLNAEQADFVKNLAAQAGQRADDIQAGQAAARASFATGGAGAATPGTAREAVGAALSPIPDRFGIGDVSDASAAVDRLSESLRKGGVFASTYQKDMENVRSVQAKLGQDASLIDAFRRQGDVTAQASIEMRDARLALDEVIRAIGQTDAPTRQMEADLRRAEAAFTASSAAAQKETAVLIAYRDRLRASKLDSDDLAGSTARITAAAEKLSTVSAQIQKKEFGFLGLRPYELKNLEYQIGDIYTQLSLGQGVLRTFNSQADQILQIFDFSIGRLKLIALYVGPAVIALGVLEKAFVRLKEQDAAVRDYTARLTASVDGANYSPQGLLETQREIERLGVSFSDAGKAVDEFVHIGLDPSRMVAFGHAAQDLVDTYGKKFPDALKEVTAGFTHGYEGVRKLDEAYNFLTAAQRERIRVLFDEGHGQEALIEVLDTFVRRQDEAAVKARSEWTNSIRALTATWHDFLDTIGDTTAFKALDDLATVKLPGLAVAFVRFFTVIAQAGTLKLTLSEIGQSFGDVFTGKPLPTPKQRELADAEVQRGTIQGSIDIAKRAESARNPGAPESDAIKSLREQLAQIETRILTLKGQAGLEGLQAQLTALEAQRDRLTKGEVGPSRQQPTTSAHGVPDEYTTMRDRVANVVGLDPEALARLQRSEGVYKDGKWQDSPTGAVGGMQVTPGTFADMKAAHPDIPGGNRDDYSNLLAGAYRFRDTLNASGGDLAGGVLRYHDGPNHQGPPSEDAAEQAATVTEGYKGSPLQTGDLATVDAQIAHVQQQIAELPASIQAAAGAMGEVRKQTELTGAALEENIKRNNDFADELHQQTASQRDRNLEGVDAAVHDAERLVEFRKKLEQEAQAKIGGPLTKAATDEIALAVAAEDTRLTGIREKAEAARAEKIISARQALNDRLRGLQAAADKDDATNADRQREAIHADYAKVYDEIAKARKAGVGTIGGMDLDQYQSQVAATEQERIEQVSAKADIAAAEKIAADRKAAFKEITDDLTKGAISLQTAFQRIVETGQKFAPTIHDTVSRAVTDLKTVGGATPSAGIKSAITKVQGFDSPGTDAATNEALKVGFQGLDQLEKTRSEEVAAAKSLQSAGTDIETVQSRIRDAYKRTQPEIEKQIAALRTQITLMHQTGKIGEPAYQVDSARLDKAGSDNQNAGLKETFNTDFKQLADIQKTRAEVASLQKTLLADGATTSEKAEEEIKKAFEGTAAESDKLIASLREQLELMNKIGAVTPIEYQKYDAQLKDATAKAKYVSDFDKQLNQTIQNSFVSRGMQAFDAIGQSLGNLIAGHEKFKNVLADVGTAFANMAAGILRDIAQMILKTLLLKAIQAGLNAIGGGGGTPMGGLYHGGGIIGSPGGMSRGFNPDWFVRAPRFHAGGAVGLAPDEVPAILQRGEEVLSKSDARNKMNAGSAGGQSGQSTSVRNVLAVGDKEIANAMTGAHGEKVILNVVKRNIPTVRKWL